MSRVQRFFKDWGRFFISIVLPTLTAIIFTVLAIYLIIIPAFEKSFVDGKKVMLQELTKAAWNIMEFYYNEEQSGRLKRQQAQNKALSLMATLRYGEHNRDYFWVTDSTPMLIMHPYSQELIGKDLSSFTDKNGKKLFLEIKDIAARQSSGFVDYSWNKKYTEEMTVPKLSFVKHFQPWDWVVGTGVFLDDVEQRTAEISGRLSRMGMAAVAVLACILLYVGRQSLLFEKQRSRVQEELAKSRIKYKRLVEAATEPILMFFGGRCIYSNTPAQKLIGLSGEELENVEIRKILSGKQEGEELSLEKDGQVLEGARHAFLLGPEAEKREATLTVSKMRLDGREAAIVSIRDTSGTRQIEKELVESREKYRQLTASLNIGVFRAQADSRMQVLEANLAFSSLLELEDGSGDLSLQEIFSRYGVSLNLYELVADTGFVKNKVVDLQRRSGSASVSLSLVLTRNADGEELYCDGILEDVSEEIRHDSHREKLIVE
ncbi:MAG TPA: cache domain-containing protein, partial [Desulfopila sp.]|nr:cache domain-containing protein [Desulfopila sp.]